MDTLQYLIGVRPAPLTREEFEILKTSSEHGESNRLFQQAVVFKTYVSVLEAYLGMRAMHSCSFKLTIVGENDEELSRLLIEGSADIYSALDAYNFYKKDHTIVYVRTSDLSPRVTG